MAKMGVFEELRRRNVLRAAVLYVTGVWALAQGIASLGPIGRYSAAAIWDCLRGP